MSQGQIAPALTGEEFTASLAEENRVALDRLGKLSAAGEPMPDLSVERLLRVALKNELEASELAAIWMSTTSELDVKLAFARQTGDEARHYRLIVDRLKTLGVDADKIDPRENGYSPLFEYLRALQSTAARVAAGQFTREGIALVRNECFIDFCEAVGDVETAALYREVIQPDEKHHHELGRRLLELYATTDNEQQVARQAAQRTLELAEEIQEMARLKTGISRAPGC
ncbi:MAG TPA: ferritin-like domain-containing protein [Blastocatellia bacterium]|nr:ferritin-like domain-containing protein [Blastocatellia bacterium]